MVVIDVKNLEEAISTSLESTFSAKKEELGLGHFKYDTKCSEIRIYNNSTSDAPSPSSLDLF